MGTLERLAGKLADDTFKAMKETGEDRLYTEVAKVLAASSQTLEEAFLTEVRIRMAAATAFKFLETKLADTRQKAKQQAAPKAPTE